MGKIKHDCATLAWLDKPENAETYEELLTNRVLPGLKSLSGYCGGYVLRSDSISDCPVYQAISESRVHKKIKDY